MHIAVGLELDKSNSLSYPSFLPEEIDYWLQRSELKIAKDTLFGSRDNLTNETNSMKNYEDLRTLLTITSYVALSADTKSRVNFGNIDLPVDFLHLESATLRNSNGDTYMAKVIDKNFKHNYLSTPTNTPWIEDPLCYVEEDKLTYIVDPTDSTFTTMTDNDGSFSYYKRPRLVSLSGSVDSELPETLHDKVVYTAANLMIENIESPRYGTNTQVIKDTL